METNSLKGSCIQTVHSIELKCSTYIASHHRTIDFTEYRMYSIFYRSTKIISDTLRPMELNSLKSSNNESVHSIELKFGMYIIDHCPIYCIDFGEFRIKSFFSLSTKRHSYALQPMESNYNNYASVQMEILIKV